ncbi:uncharacterized protein TNCV_3317431 [Trichonephila clavipes]|nr:uncharacterized protein TNCV_3317431 [Trichonephila clavipes]
MPVVSDPCSCQSDCFLCGRGEEHPHDCAIPVLLESMVFQERMLHGEFNEAKLEEILKNGKEYLPLAMLMTDENSVRWQTMYNYVKSGFPEHQGNSSRNTGGCWSPTRSFQSIQICKRFDSLVIQGKDVLPAHKQYPIMTQKSKLVTPDVVFTILNAELSSLATSFAISLNAVSALVENPSNLFAESYKTSPVLHVQDSPVPISLLVRLWVQTFIQKVQDMRRMQNGSKPSIQMVYEACLRAERLALPERLAQIPESMHTPSAQRPERMPTPPERPANPVVNLSVVVFPKKWENDY